ncbi:hemoglobin [Arcicella aurantiaca]|uniref:Hemoglobin n=1 Tax=Arcicella aurantiaca TaxID=591202 RepID=A0A316E9L9_9BACT|nr:group III truncated hemoglobin [Arcicella aurantiaca]PWK26252.1 hemoglobin [Arcicella aurantiaca]
MQDINNRTDVEKLVTTFYENVHKDPLLAPIFEMPTEEWTRHLTRAVNFWENWLFDTGSYTGGMMWVHAQANMAHGLTTERFEHWLSHWFSTVDSLFTGENATFVKNKALEIGQIMNSKFNQAPSTL